MRRAPHPGPLPKGEGIGRRAALARGRAAGRDDERVVVGGVSISHPDRLIYADLGLTKLDIASYYDAIAEWMLPHVGGRPLTLLRCAGAIDNAADKGGCVMLR